MACIRFILFLLTTVSLHGLAIAAGSSGPAPQVPPSLSQATAWVDPHGSLDIDAVVSRAGSLQWGHLDPQRAWRLNDQTLWLQFEATTPAASRWFLVLKHPAVDRMQLYWRGADGRWVVQTAGQQLPVSEWSIPGRVPTFELAPPGQTARYWVRLERDHSHLSLPLALLSQSELLQERAHEQFLLGGYFGILLVLILGALALAAAYRERKFTAFAAYIVALTAVQLVVLGVGAQLLWADQPHWNAMARLAVPGPAAAAGLWFVKVLTEPARFSRALDLACSALLAALLAAVAVNASVATRASFVLVTLLMAAAVPLALSLLVLAWRRGRDPYIRTITLGFTPVLAAAAIPLLYSVGLLPNTALARHALTIGTAIHLPIIYFVLSRRALRRRETGLRAQQLHHADALTGLFDRESTLQRLDEAIRRAIGQRHLCAVLGVRLTNLETLEEDLGRSTAERALVVAASILRGAGGDLDVAGRVGERDFVLLLEGPTHGPTAISRAQQIVAQGLQHAPVLPPNTDLKFHVAVILLPDGELDAPRCLQWLAQACDAMRADPRRAIRALNF
ncbi:diguanylate cyclase [Ramlibacter sp. AW1]|uniref:Diguanylate cyclase n=1 Tax=Ramlibacter aurantiacus TaxID=2801330 RepID=A0A936ZIP2_9BURK|nr:diguanylate cyclase [Ramlibacter aurantiacus]